MRIVFLSVGTTRVVAVARLARVEPDEPDPDLLRAMRPIRHFKKVTDVLLSRPALPKKGVWNFACCGYVYRHAQAVEFQTPFLGKALWHNKGGYSGASKGNRDVRGFAKG